MVQEILTPPRPDISNLVLEDDKPVDNFQSEQQQRLLVEPLYSSKPIPTPFLVAANVGLFYQEEQEGICPDCFLSLKVKRPQNWTEKQNRSYLFWKFGKPPEVVIEIVSNRRGHELVDVKIDSKVKTAKLETYAQLGIAYYIIFDPLKQIQEPAQMNGRLLKAYGLTVGRYKELEVKESYWLETVGIGLTLWDGKFEDVPGPWLRWCDKDGKVIPTGAEATKLERQRANREQERANLLAARLRELGEDPNNLV